MKTKKSTKAIFTKTKNYSGYIVLYKIDINKILQKESYGTKNSLKYFIGYNDDDFIRPLCIKVPQKIGYVKCFDSNKTISFKVVVNKLLKNRNKIWEKS